MASWLVGSSILERKKEEDVDAEKYIKVNDPKCSKCNLNLSNQILIWILAYFSVACVGDGRKIGNGDERFDEIHASQEEEEVQMWMNQELNQNV